MPTAASYGTYLSENGFCHFDRSKGLEGLQGVAAPPPGATMNIDVGAVVQSCWGVANPVMVGEKASIKQISHALVSEGPMAVDVQASDQDFYYYLSGVYDNPKCQGAIDHVVLLNGYGVDQGISYWHVRNSWSMHWSEGGYIRLAREGNICEITTHVVFAHLQ